MYLLYLVSWWQWHLSILYLCRNISEKNNSCCSKIFCYISFLSYYKILDLNFFIFFYLTKISWIKVCSWKEGRSRGRPQNIKYGTCQFGSFLRRATSPLSLPALPYPAPIFSARASSATVADALISLSNVTSRPRHAFDTWYFLRGVVWSHDKAGPVQFVHNGEIQHMAQGAPILGLK